MWQVTRNPCREPKDSRYAVFITPEQLSKFQKYKLAMGWHNRDCRKKRGVRRLP